ncbi:MAG: cation:proton antiporter [Candidatus Omnitrophica bacterium]|nr:cation:proton antiporter [Candidatus Omnitrophota bacterium]
MIQRHDSIIVQSITRLLIPLIQLFALYVLTHGHYSPGGGFQAGVLIGGSIILKLLVGSQEERQSYSITNEFILAGLGVVIYLIAGAAPLFQGGDFFDYGFVTWLGAHTVERRYWAILLAETGVTLTVSMTLVVIFHALAITQFEDDSHES